MDPDPEDDDDFPELELDPEPEPELDPLEPELELDPLLDTSFGSGGGFLLAPGWSGPFMALMSARVSGSLE